MKRSYRRIQAYRALLSRWSRMLLGRSYWHATQGIGQRFEAGHLAGYFNDLTAKTRWMGPTDENGLPLSHGSKQGLVVFPTVVLQKALGHWDAWLIDDQEYERYTFLQLVSWAVQAQDEQGGWALWKPLGLRFASDYSAMTQGEGISVLARAFVTTEDERFLDAARAAYELMILPITQGGTSRYLGGGLVLEEYPSEEVRTVLNGWIFALFGLYDYCLVADSDEARRKRDLSLETLVRWLSRYDAGYWSRYDSSGQLASPFYHNLHCAQLAALEQAFPHKKEAFAEIRHRFEQYQRSRWKRLRAVSVKVYQKLRSPEISVESTK